MMNGWSMMILKQWMLPSIVVERTRQSNEVIIVVGLEELEAGSLPRGSAEIVAT
jgi:hypothetical protein